MVSDYISCNSWFSLSYIIVVQINQVSFSGYDSRADVS